MWRKLDLELTPVTPIHIGHLKYGFINKTKLYIPYYIIHAAINKLVYLEHRQKENKKKFISTSFMFYQEDRLLTPQEIKTGYLFSTTSTAIDNRTRTARENTLHNVEFISPEKVFGKDKNQIRAKGSLFVREEFFSILMEVLDKYSSSMFIGGEIKYGYGRTKLKILDITQIDNPAVKVEKGSILRELVRADIKSSQIIDGEKEVVFLRKTRNFEKHGGWTWYEGLFFSPFSVANADGLIDLATRKIHIKIKNGV